MGTLGGFPNPPAMGSGGQSPPAPHAMIPSRRALLALALAAPACYTGSAHTVPPGTATAMGRDPAWQITPDVPFVAQRTAHDCGPAALAMVLAHFRVAPPAADHPELARGDVRAGALRDVARERGLEAYVVSGTFDD